MRKYGRDSVYTNTITTDVMPEKDNTIKPNDIPDQQTPGAASDDGMYTVRMTDAATGKEHDVRVRMSGAERMRRLYTLWPTFTPYIVGFTLLGFSFIAHTLRLFLLFSVLLAVAAVLVIGTAIYRFVRPS